MKRSHTPEDVEKIQSGWRKRQIQMQITMNNDDIQEYVRPWVGLTDEDIALIDWESLITKKDCVKAIEAKLKEKNT
jgi:hypothetical protein